MADTVSRRRRKALQHHQDSCKKKGKVRARRSARRAEKLAAIQIVNQG